jgi:hypothetical protein
MRFNRVFFNNYRWKNKTLLNPPKGRTFGKSKIISGNILSI